MPELAGSAAVSDRQIDAILQLCSEASQGFPPLLEQEDSEAFLPSSQEGLAFYEELIGKPDLKARTALALREAIEWPIHHRMENGKYVPLPSEEQERKNEKELDRLAEAVLQALRAGSSTTLPTGQL